MRAGHTKARLLAGIAIAAVAVVAPWRTPPAHANGVVLCTQVTCTSGGGQCGPNGSCVDSICSCTSDQQCPTGTLCLVAGGFCARCPATPTPTVTPTGTPTSTPTNTATATASATPTTTGMPGAACTDPGQCSSGFCVDRVCCETACDGPGEACNVSGNGVCTPLAAAAPALSGRGSLLVVLLLAATGLWALARRRHD